MARGFVAMGSNVAPAASMRAALRALSALGEVVAVSTLYRTPSLAQDGQPDFYNGVAELQTTLALPSLAAALKEIERSLGRARSADRWAARTIDLDLLFYVAPDTAAWPGLGDVRGRAFVAVPLYELAPDLVLPDGQRLQDAVARAPPWPMVALEELTRTMRKDLRKDLRNEPRESARTRPRSAHRDR